MDTTLSEPSTTDNSITRSTLGLLTEAQITRHLDAWLAAHGDSLIETRRYIHAHPELSGAEHGTASLLAERLTAAGLQPRFIPQGNGLLCEIGSGSRAIGLRADLDALPLQDVKQVPYKSTVDGVCHACGHDVHTTVLLGTMLALAALGDALPCRVRAIFQPSEESAPLGSHDMIAAGAVTDLDEIYALHCYPQLPAGQVGLRVGPFTAACDKAQIRLTGPGGHSARPHLTVDLVGALARIVAEAPAMLARRFDSRSGLVLVFGSMHAGVAANVIPQHASAGCTIRVMDTDIWRQIPAAFTEVVQQLAAPTGAEVEIEFGEMVPPVVNDERLVSVLATAAGQALGPAAVQSAPHSMGGEDFSWYLEHVPGAMARLGTGKLGQELDLHRGDFDVDESAIGHGVRLMVHTVLEAQRR